MRTILFLCFLLPAVRSSAQQEIPLGTWRLHPSYNSIHAIVAGGADVYASAETAIMVLHEDNSSSSITKLSGLTGGSITCLAYDPLSKKILVGYEDGNLDLIDDSGITNFDRIFTSPDVTGSKRINHIGVNGSIAYLGTDFGVVLFDIGLNEIRETWRDLGPAGERVQVFQSAFHADSIFLATSDGVQAGDLSDNLLDFSLWKRFNTGDFSAAVQCIASVMSGELFASVDGLGLYSYQTGVWTKEPHLDGDEFHSLSGTSRLVIAAGSGVYTLNGSGVLSPVTSPLVTGANYATETSTGQLMIGDSRNGLVKESQSVLVSYLPDGPTQQVITRLRYHDGRMYALAGGYQTTMLPANIQGDVNFFESGTWSSETSPLNNLTDIAFTFGKQFLSSYVSGVQQGPSASPEVVYDDQNSTLATTATGVSVTAMVETTDGLWVTNYGAVNSLHLLNSTGSWQEHSFGLNAARYPIDAVSDFSENIWMRLHPAQGGGILAFNTSSGQSAYLTNVAGSGGLPNRNVRSLALDKSGYMWVGMDEGVGYFANPSFVYGNSTNIIRPIFESRYLLQTERVTALAVDGGDRKWMGTENGLWLFGPTGEELIYNFTKANSPLPSNRIVDVSIHDKTGEVFVATDKGLASFRSDATAPADFTSVKIFPNPVPPGFRGLVGIEGLSENAFVKITDASGRLIYNTQANGGSASWNVLDLQGRRAATGVYLIFSTSFDGSESFVGKVAVVE